MRICDGICYTLCSYTIITTLSYNLMLKMPPCFLKVTIVMFPLHFSFQLLLIDYFSLPVEQMVTFLYH